MLMSPVGLRSEKYCAGDAQQHYEITRVVCITST
jgi:hypothetical protein